MPETRQILQDTGLSEKEVTVYLALLKTGEETASRISEIAQLNRITTYTLLKSLQEKGFCSVYNKNKVQYFKPINPEQIISILEEKKNKVKSIIPELKQHQNKIKKRPEISLFEGKKGITSLLSIILKDAERNKEVFAYGNLTIAEKLIEYQSLHWRKTRIEKKIKIKAIIDSIAENINETREWKKLTEIRLNKSLSKIDTYIMITKESVAHITLKGELTGILIKNKEIAEKEKFNFEILWKK